MGLLKKIPIMLWILYLEAFKDFPNIFLEEPFFQIPVLLKLNFSRTTQRERERDREKNGSEPGIM